MSEKPVASMKNKTLKRKGYVIISDILFPISTKGIPDIRKAYRVMRDNEKLPMKVSIANEDEKKALIGLKYSTNKLGISVNRVDESSDKYKEYIDKKDRVALFINIAIQIDMEYPVGEEREPLWQHLELKSNTDILGLAIWLSELGMFEKDIKVITDTITLIKDSTCKSYDEWEKIASKAKNTKAKYKELLMDVEDDGE